MPDFPGTSQEVQDQLQDQCCYVLCPPVTELEDNQFLAVVLWALIRSSGVDPFTAYTQEEIRDAAQAAWCEYNMATFCSFPNDRIKATILALIQNTIA